MSASENATNMNDARLKPSMLRNLVRENLPDENGPSRIPLELSEIISLIETHKLLSESLGDSTDKKFVESWKSAVDKWVDRLTKLISSSLSDKCWMGICLLGLTCQVCKIDRFVASYSVWFNKLLLHIQQPTESQFLKAASCNSLAEIFERLDGLPNAKKDGSSLAGKVIQPVLKLLNEDSSEKIWEAAIQLLCTILTLFPASVHRFHESVEAAVASKLFSGKCSVNLMKKFAYCLALLPHSKGDNESWCLMMQKILLFINNHLNDFFQGFEEETRGSDGFRELFPPGIDPPPPLGSSTLLGRTSGKKTRGSDRVMMPGVSMLILCCCKMLTCSYPVRVTIPINSLLALVDRVLKVDGSVPRASLPFMTAMQQENACLELPVLHHYSLELLIAIIQGMRSQLMPYAASIVRLIKGYFKQCAHPELRIKLYSITKSLTTFIGIGMAASLAQEVFDHASVDLNSVGPGALTTNVTPGKEAAVSCSHRKRKHGTMNVSLKEQHEITGLLEVSKVSQTAPISLKIAALEALEALFTVGASLISESCQTSIDILLITLATDSSKQARGIEEKNNFLPNEPTLTWVDLQLATLHALLASLLSPARVRPPYLANALDLFRKGKQEGGAQLAGFCTHALLNLEVLIHPRALPLQDSSPATYNCFFKGNPTFPENVYAAGRNHGTTGYGAPHFDSDDFLVKQWLEHGSINEDHLKSSGNNSNNMDITLKTAGVNMLQKTPMADSSGTSIPEKIMEERTDVRSFNNDQIMQDLGQLQELRPNPEAFPGEEIGKGTSGGGLGNNNGNEATLYDDLPEDRQDKFVDKGDALVEFGKEKGKGSVFDMDSDASSEAFPDIVEVDPDSGASD